MAKACVHFIWMGNVENPRKRFFCQFGPSNLAKLNNEVEINLWVENSTATQVKILVSKYKNISVHTVDEMLSGQYRTIRHFDEVQLEKIKSIIKKMDAKNMPAGKKDFLSFFILAEFGGYFFDSTTSFIKEPELIPVKAFKLPLLNSYPFVAMNKEKWQGLDHFIEKADKLDLEVGPPLIDVWAMAACEGGHKFFRQYLNAVLKNSVYENETGSLVLYLSEWLGENFTRELLTDKNWHDSNIWRFSSDEENKREVIEEIGIEKIHLNSWLKNKTYEVPPAIQKDFLSYLSITQGFFESNQALSSDNANSSVAENYSKLEVK